MCASLVASSPAPPAACLQFQQSTEAWQVTNDILHEAGAGMEAHYFAAQTLRTKVLLARSRAVKPWHAMAALRCCLRV